MCGKAWSSLPSLSGSDGELDAPIDMLLKCIMRMFAAPEPQGREEPQDAPTGLVVASSDVLLLIPESFYPAPGKPSLWAPRGATGLAIPTDKALGPNHGVYHCAAPPQPGSHVARVSKFFQKATVPEMAAAGAVRADDKVLIDTGVIFFSAETTAVLLELARLHPLDSCTYAGLDCGRPALRIELYSDIMMAMDKGLGLSLQQYQAVASSETRAEELRLARSVMWEQLSAAPFYAAVVEGGDFAHVGTTLEYLQLLTAPTPVQTGYGLRPRAAWFAEGVPVVGVGGCEEAAPAAVCCIQNSLFATPGSVGAGSVVEHSVLTGAWSIGEGCLVSSVRTLQGITVRSGVAVQELALAGGGRCVTVLECRDPIKEPFTRASARVCGVPWARVFEAMAALGGLPGDGAGRAPGSAARDAIWGKGQWETDAAACTLWTARLWPVSGRGIGAGSSSSSSVVDGLRLGGYGDPVSPDMTALWLQWLASEGGSGGGAAASAAHAALRAAHLDSAVVTAWLNSTRLSLKDILGAAEAGAEFAWRRSLRGNIDCALLVCSIAQDSAYSCADLVRRVGHSATPTTTRLEGAAGTAGGLGSASTAASTAAASGAQAAGETFAHIALRRLDAIAAGAPPNIAGRALAVQSALLWAMAGWGVHGHRSGPAYNAQWLPALSLLDGDVHAGGRGEQPGSRAAAVAQLAALRSEWCARGAHLTGRAARHYERAAQLLTAQCIYTAPVAHPASAAPEAMPPLGAWMCASAPVRIDLAGGWSDTPPITYEARSVAGGGGSAAAAAAAAATLSPEACASAGGGLVVNAGVLLDGVRSLGARVRRVALAPGAPLIVVRTRGRKQLGGGGGPQGGMAPQPPPRLPRLPPRQTFSAPSVTQARPGTTAPLLQSAAPAPLAPSLPCTPAAAGRPGRCCLRRPSPAWGTWQTTTSPTPRAPW